ncbi:MAG: cupin domain-containing protein [Dokdonella sp.]
MIEITASAEHRLGMPAAQFLREYWQRKPLLIRGAFADLGCPITPEDLAGLACEEFALSRIVIHDAKRDRWALESGPFEETRFASLPKRDWTLLVQDVDKWDADVGALLAAFDFLPTWRIDDIMVSYAVDGGSVGAHVDQYDVFLLQAQGNRRWKIDTTADPSTEFRDDAELRLLREFNPDHDWLLEPGDMLYLPPGIPHHGVAEGDCLTFSIGMRAPSVSDLIVDFAESLAEGIPEEWRYRDAGMGVANEAGEIDASALVRVREALTKLSDIDDASLAAWFPRFITRYRAANTPAPRPKPLSAVQWQRDCESGARLQRNPWARLAWIAQDEGATLYACGEAFPCSLAIARQLCDRQAVNDIDIARLNVRDADLVLELINAGMLGLHKPRASRSRR